MYATKLFCLRQPSAGAWLCCTFVRTPNLPPIRKPSFIFWCIHFPEKDLFVYFIGAIIILRSTFFFFFTFLSIILFSIFVVDCIYEFLVLFLFKSSDFFYMQKFCSSFWAFVVL